jgi:hypothetical protein
MTTVSPPAVRLRRPGWRDPRLLGGLVLVALSVALGGYAVAAAGRTVPVLATASALVPGDAVDPDALVVREVRLAEAGDLYLRADRPADADLVAVRTVGPGEIVPLAAVAPAAALDLRSVTVTSRAALSEQVVPGASVDLWFVPDAGTTDPAQEPRQLATGLTVAEVSDPGGAFSVGGVSTVHVLVPADQLPEVLGALAADGSVEVVPVAGVVP